jgi:hypothetical protein
MVLLERDAFLGQLRDMLVAARRGRGGVALVVGEAGIGKTSLVDAFRAAAPASTRILWVHVIRSNRRGRSPRWRTSQIASAETCDARWPLAIGTVSLTRF